MKVNSSNQVLDAFFGFRPCKDKKQTFYSNGELKECTKLNVINLFHNHRNEQSNFGQNFPNS